MARTNLLVASIEFGGTKTVAAVGRDPLAPLAVARIATRDAAATLGDVEAFFRQAIADHGAPAALGISSFGPVVLDRALPAWGHVATTPKPGWSGADVAGRLGCALSCPVALDTDVNAAALAENRLGAGKDCDPLVYLTVGTGIGGGLVANGKVVHGLMHPEMGHLLVRRHVGDSFAGTCSYHGDCAEGLASGPSVLARFGVTAGELPPDHPFQAILADYLGQLCAAIVLIAAPQRIVIGGGVMSGGGRLEPIAAAMREALGGYVSAPALHAARFLVSPAFENSGLVGAFLLATGA